MNPKSFKQDEVAQARRWRAPPMRGEGAISHDLIASGLGAPTAAEIEAWEKESRDEGFKRGYEEGKAAARAELQNEIQALGKIRRALTNSLQNFDSEAETQLVQLALLIARQVLRRELRTDPGEVIPVVREALALLPVGAREVRIHLHPDDANLVREVLAPGDDARLHLVQDPLISRGGCQVRSEHSFIDATLENRLAALTTKVLGGERESD